MKPMTVWQLYSFQDVKVDFGKQDKQGSSHRHSKHSHRDRPGLFSVCLSLVHRSEDADGSESTESDRHDMTSEGTSGVIHATSLPRPDAPKGNLLSWHLLFLNRPSKTRLFCGLTQCNEVE